MKLILVASMAAVLAMGMSDKAEAHGYPSAAGGSIVLGGDGLVIGLNYGVPLVRPHYVPPRYVYHPRAAYRSDYRKRHYYSHAHGYKKGYRKGYSKGYRKGHGKGHRHDWRHDHRYDRRGHRRH